MNVSDEEEAVFVRADITKFDDPTKKRWESVKKIKGLVGAQMLSNEIEMLISKAH